MKVAICFLVLVGVALCTPVQILDASKLRKPARQTTGAETQKPVDERIFSSSYSPHFAWHFFRKKFDKVYISIEEEAYRFGVFVDNLRYIMQHNLLQGMKEKKYRLGISMWTDMTHSEFVHTMNGFRRGYNRTVASHNGVLYDSLQETFMKPSEVPKAMDWRKKGAVTPVKNQEQCGSCWAFSSTGSLEGQHFLKSGKLVSLSEQNLVDCSTKFGNNGCNGGLMDNAFTYVKQNGGLDTEKSYPYEGEDDTCRFTKANVGATDQGYQDVRSGDEDALKQTVASVGPISVAIDAGHRSFQHYSDGVYDNEDCSRTQLDHGVLVVGYGTSDEGDDYWTVKNSWSALWGEEGYIRMARNKDNQCGIATQASYPVVD